MVWWWCVCENGVRASKVPGEPDPLKLDLQVVVNCSTWALGTELGFIQDWSILFPTGPSLQPQCLLFLSHQLVEQVCLSDSS